MTSPSPIRVVGLSGSLRKGSFNTAALRAAQAGQLTDETTKQVIRQLLVSLAAWTRRLQASVPAASAAE